MTIKSSKDINLSQDYEPCPVCSFPLYGGIFDTPDTKEVFT